MMIAIVVNMCLSFNIAGLKRGLSQRYQEHSPSTTMLKFWLPTRELLYVWCWKGFVCSMWAILLHIKDKIVESKRVELHIFHAHTHITANEHTGRRALFIILYTWKRGAKLPIIFCLCLNALREHLVQRKLGRMGWRAGLSFLARHGRRAIPLAAFCILYVESLRVWCFLYAWMCLFTCW